MKKSIVAVSLFVFLFIAFWLGESGKGFLRVWPYLIGLVGAMVLSCLICKKWTHRVFCSFLFVILDTAALYMGDLSFNRAYDSCLHEAEQIKTALSAYKIRHDDYPYALDDLNMRLSCSRWLRGTILGYDSTASDYRLSFKDWLVEHSATAEEPFLAHK